MKAIPTLHILWYSFLFYLGFEYIALDRQLLNDFSEVGWNNYNGLPLDAPENQYFSLWLGSSILSMVMLLFVRREAAPFVVYVRWMTVFFGLVYLFLYWADGDPNIRETSLWWALTSASQVLGNVLLLFNNRFIRYKNDSLRKLFLLQALGYLVLVGVGLYYLYWDGQLAQEIERMGDLHHDNVMLGEGRGNKVPERNYHRLLIVTSILSLVLLYWTRVDNPWKLPLRFSLIGLFLYSFFIYASNTYKYTMFGTLTFWMLGCGVVSAFSFLLHKNIKVEPEMLPPAYRDDVLDDFLR
ncbi:MAG: hypothetical protein AB8E82_08810 [Aureispira sp.]